MIYDNWRKGRSEKYKEKSDLPSMVEPCYNPSISEIVNNPNCLLRPRTPYYDDGDEIEYVESNWENDLQSQLSATADNNKEIRTETVSTESNEVKPNYDVVRTENEEATNT